jgi:hypothetical protein
MKFGIVIKHERYNVRLLVELVYQSPEVERYKVTAKNGSFVLQTNLPLLRNKGLKYKPADWKVVENAVNNRSILDSVIKAIEAKLRTL